MSENIGWLLLVVLFSVAAFVRISSVASFLRKQESKTLSRIAIMMYCSCAEILFAAAAIFFIRWIYVWAGLKVIGLLIQVGGVESFQRYLDKLYKEDGKPKDDTPPPQ